MRHAWFLLAVAACTEPALPVDPPGPDDDPLTPGAPDAALPEVPAPENVQLAKVYTRRLGNLVGSARSPLAPGLTGTDLGVSFVRDGKLVFLFGDSWTTEDDSARWNEDSVALASPTFPESGLPVLSWVTGANGRFLSLDVPLTRLLAMNVPVEGVVHGERTYLFFSDGWSDETKRHSTSVLAHASGLDFAHLTLDHKVPSEKFINVSVVREGDLLWIWGSGSYRQSPVYLARVRADDLVHRDRWRYRDASGAFVPGEANAVPVVSTPCVGEFSVRRHPTRSFLLMTYNCDAPRGISLRTAAAPDAPWSEPIVIFDPAPERDRGYGHFMHSLYGYDDGLSEAGRGAEWGGEYGPYLVPEWTREIAPGVHALSWVMSSWNPYTVHLMQTVLVEPGATAPLPDPGAGLPPATLANGDFASDTFAGWHVEGNGFGLFVGGDGQRRLTTYVAPLGDAVVGRLWQDLTVDAGAEALVFSIHGGHATVSLWDGPDRVRWVSGHDTNDVETPVRWNLEGLRGKTLRLVVDDAATDPWGFVGTTGFRIERR